VTHHIHTVRTRTYARSCIYIACSHSGLWCPQRTTHSRPPTSRRDIAETDSHTHAHRFTVETRAGIALALRAILLAQCNAAATGRDKLPPPPDPSRAARTAHSLIGLHDERGTHQDPLLGVHIGTQWAREDKRWPTDGGRVKGADVPTLGDTLGGHAVVDRASR
jgi:hypothetical protein